MEGRLCFNMGTRCEGIVINRHLNALLALDILSISYKWEGIYSSCNDVTVGFK